MSSHRYGAAHARSTGIFVAAARVGARQQGFIPWHLLAPPVLPDSMFVVDEFVPVKCSFELAQVHPLATERNPTRRPELGGSIPMSGRGSVSMSAKARRTARRDCPRAMRQQPRSLQPARRQAQDEQLQRPPQGRTAAPMASAKTGAAYLNSIGTRGVAHFLFVKRELLRYVPHNCKSTQATWAPAKMEAVSSQAPGA